MSFNLVKFKNKSNCENDSDVLLQIDTNRRTNSEVNNFYDDEITLEDNLFLSADDFSEENPDDDLFMENLEIDWGTNDIEQLSMRYFVGYVAYKVLLKIDCTMCSERFLKIDEVLTCPTEIFIFEKNYSDSSDFGKLTAPSTELFNVCRNHIKIFQSIFETEPQMRYIKYLITEKCKSFSSDWFNSNDFCYEHKIQLLDFMILVLLRKHCIWAVKKSNKVSNRKLRILKS